jgi:8-oxo-dGTP pyrophosphatase MutT (NUDIX family)
MSDNAPVTPVPAATVCLLRDAPAGMEVFMVVRHHQIDFASGALVFPGGKADPQDYDPALAARCDGADEVMHGLQVATIREAFEECGVFLARPAGAQDLIDGARLRELEAYRQQLVDGEITISALAEREDLTLACDHLTRFAHWVTPSMMPKRFDTHFYLCSAPADHLAVHDGHESVDSVWITPDAAVADAASGKHTIIFPTLRVIHKLNEFDTAAQAIAASATASIVRVEPWTEQRDDGTYLCIPPEAGYDVSEQKMPERG